jgi:hypothetical protein
MNDFTGVNFHAPDGATIGATDFGDLTDSEQHDWCEEHGVPLAYQGDMQRFAQGVPAVYAHLTREGILSEEEIEAVEVAA